MGAGTKKRSLRVRTVRTVRTMVEHITDVGGERCHLVCRSPQGLYRAHHWFVTATMDVLANEHLDHYECMRCGAQQDRISSMRVMTGAPWVNHKRKAVKSVKEKEVVEV